jgi:hypothetical protein
MPLKPGDRIADELPTHVLYCPHDGWSEVSAAQAGGDFDRLVDYLRDEASADGEWADSAASAALYRLVPVRRLVLVVTDVDDDAGEWDYTADGVIEECPDPDALDLAEHIAALDEIRAACIAAGIPEETTDATGTTTRWSTPHLVRELVAALALAEETTP